MLQRTLIVILFINLLIFLAIIGVRNALSKEDSIGKSPINRFLFIITKISFLVPWAFAFAGALKPELLPEYFSNSMAWVAIILIIIGFVIEIAGYVSLGIYTRFGLPTSESRLITSGIFKYCRHPMYLGLFIMIIGTTIYFPHWIAITCCVITIILHHKVALAEEKYMANIFSNDWEEYKKGSKMYLLW